MAAAVFVLINGGTHTQTHTRGQVGRLKRSVAALGLNKRSCVSFHPQCSAAECVCVPQCVCVLLCPTVRMRVLPVCVCVFELCCPYYVLFVYLSRMCK